MIGLVWAVIVIMTILGAVASVFLKRASGESGLASLLRNASFWLGGGCYGIAALLNIWVLRHLDLSVVLPVTALTYVWTLLIARAFLGERLTWRKVVGVGLILVGVAMIAST